MDHAAGSVEAGGVVRNPKLAEAPEQVLIATPAVHPAPVMHAVSDLDDSAKALATCRPGQWVIVEKGWGQEGAEKRLESQREIEEEAEHVVQGG